MHTKWWSWCRYDLISEENTTPMQDTAAAGRWRLVLGYRASKSQSWNLTQSLLDSESGVADRALFAFASCALSEGPHTHKRNLRVDTNKLCPSPQWLFLDPCSWNWGYPHGWCSLLWGGQLTWERGLDVGLGVGLCISAKNVILSIPKWMSLRVRVRVPLTLWMPHSWGGRWMSEYNALKYGPGQA